MKTKEINNVKVGLFVLVGTLFLVFSLYMIGKNRNLIGKNFTLNAIVENANGLMEGSNVRFLGIDVGRVKNIQVVNDTAIMITMVIDDKVRPFLKKDAVASIVNDGLMGNKLLNISAGSGNNSPIEGGDILQSVKPIGTDEMLRTLNSTNTNIEMISRNLYEITERLNGNNNLWTLLSDTVMAQDLKVTVNKFQKAATNAADFTYSANSLMTDLNAGDGLVRKFFTDTAYVQQVAHSILQLKKVSDEAILVVHQLNDMTGDIQNGESTAGMLLYDTALRQSLLNTTRSIEEGSANFNQNMEALKSNFLLRGYFRKLEKKQKNIKEKSVENK